LLFIPLVFGQQFFFFKKERELFLLFLVCPADLVGEVVMPPWSADTALDCITVFSEVAVLIAF
jgi:hypothetical protein